MKVSSTEFQQNVGRYQDTAQREPVTITKNGRPHSVLVSAEFFKMATQGRVARTVGTLDADTIAAIKQAEVPAKYAYLDDTVKND